MKRFLKSIFILAVLLGIGAFAAYFLAKKYEPEVREIVLYEVNRKLAVPIQVEDINLSLMQRFPYASLRFSNVVVPKIINGEQQNDTLLYVHDLYLQIGLLDFFSKNYTVSDAELNEGFFDMELFEKGDNFHFWKSSTDTSSGAELAVTQIHINNFEYRLKTASQLDLRIQVEKGFASGDFGEDVYEIESESELNILSIIQSGDTMYQNQTVQGDIALAINHTEKTYLFNSGKLSLADENYSVTGSYSPNTVPYQWDVKLQSGDADLAKAMELIPIQAKAKLSKYSTRGGAEVDVHLQSGDDFDLDVDFDKLEGSFQQEVALGTAKLKNAKGRLSFHNGVGSLDIKNLNLSIGPGEIHTAGTIFDFQAPAFDLSVKGGFELEELKSFLNIQLLETLEGEVSLDGDFLGKISANAKSETAELLKGLEFKGEIKIVDGIFKMKGLGQTYNEINGQLSIENNAVMVQSTTAKVNDMPFEISGSIQNALPYMTRQGEKLHIDADFYAAELDFNSIFNSTESEVDTTYSIELPQSVSFNIILEVDRILFRQFKANEVKGNAVYNNNMLTLNPLEFKSASGQIATNISLTEKRDEGLFYLESRSKLKGINLDELFTQFENFGQSLIEAKNVNGLSDAKIYFATSFKKDLSIIKPSVESNIELAVFDGKLYNVQALASIGEYLKQSPIYRSVIDIDALDKRLSAIDFDTLANTIQIKNETVTIPEMTIVSSALTINLSGTQTFDNDIDYHLNFRLSDILKKGQAKENEFGNIVDDETGMRIFLKMYGNTSDPKFSMDKESAKANRKNQLNAEKQTVKSILKGEFGFFKNDSSVTTASTPEKKDKTQFTVEWGDSTKTKADSTKVKPKKKPKNSEDEDLYNDSDEDDDL